MAKMAKMAKVMVIMMVMGLLLGNSLQVRAAEAKATIYKVVAEKTSTATRQEKDAEPIEFSSGLFKVVNKQATWVQLNLNEHLTTGTASEVNISKEGLLTCIFTSESGVTYEVSAWVKLYKAVPVQTASEEMSSSKISEKSSVVIVDDTDGDDTDGNDTDGDDTDGDDTDGDDTDGDDTDGDDTDGDDTDGDDTDGDDTDGDEPPADDPEDKGNTKDDVQPDDDDTDGDDTDGDDTDGNEPPANDPEDKGNTKDDVQP